MSLLTLNEQRDLLFLHPLVLPPLSLQLLQLFLLFLLHGLDSIFGFPQLLLAMPLQEQLPDRVVLPDLPDLLLILLENELLGFEDLLFELHLLVLEELSLFLEIDLVLADDGLVLLLEKPVDFVHLLEPRLFPPGQDLLVLEFEVVVFLALVDLLDHFLNVLDLLEHFLPLLGEELDFVVQLLVFQLHLLSLLLQRPEFVHFVVWWLRGRGFLHRRFQIILNLNGLISPSGIII